MTALAVYTALGILALATAAAITVTLGRGAEQLDRLTPRGYDPAPPVGDRPPIVINPGRDPE